MWNCVRGDEMDDIKVRWRSIHSPYSENVEQLLGQSDHMDLYGKPGTFRRKLDELVRGNHVVEIGASFTPLKILFGMNPASYTCVEAGFNFARNTPEWVGYNFNDGLSFLRTISDDSVVVVSSGLFDESILDRDYALELAQAIRAKTISGGLTFHTTAGDYNKLFPEAGFELDYGIRSGGEISESDMTSDSQADTDLYFFFILSQSLHHVLIHQ